MGPSHNQNLIRIKAAMLSPKENKNGVDRLLPRKKGSFWDVVFSLPIHPYLFPPNLTSGLLLFLVVPLPTPLIVVCANLS
jgi:hypothetical protein